MTLTNQNSRKKPLHQATLALSPVGRVVGVVSRLTGERGQNRGQVERNFQKTGIQFTGSVECVEVY